MPVQMQSRVPRVCAAMTFVARATPPDADVAGAVLESARTPRADQYAQDWSRAAEEAQTALEAELQSQERLLHQAALDAVRRWEYRPSPRDGRPVPVVTVSPDFQP